MPSASWPVLSPQAKYCEFNKRRDLTPSKPTNRKFVWSSSIDRITRVLLRMLALKTYFDCEHIVVWKWVTYDLDLIENVLNQQLYGSLEVNEIGLDYPAPNATRDQVICEVFHKQTADDPVRITSPLLCV